MFARATKQAASVSLANTRAASASSLTGLNNSSSLFNFNNNSSETNQFDLDGIITRQYSQESVMMPKFPEIKKRYKESEKRETGDVARRSFTYMMVGAGGFFYASAVKSCVVDFVSQMSASADVLAMASIEVDLNEIEEGKTLIVKWRGKPLFIRHRTPEEIEAAKNVDMGELVHKQTDEERATKPDYLVLLGVCTHLGCVPLDGQGDYNGWFCPCHGSHYDTSGRIRKGPAPLNLEIPPHKYMDDTTLLVG